MVINDKTNAFTVVKQKINSSNDFLMSYRTISTADHVPDKFLIVTDQTSNYSTETAIPVTFFKTNILCCLESGLYFAKQDENGDIVVSNITFGFKEITPNTIHIIRKSDTDIPLLKLKPFTMVEMPNKGIIMVCSIEDDNSKFVMILTEKTGPEAIEILEVDYSLSQHRVYHTSESEENATLDEDITDSSPTNSNTTTSEVVDGLTATFTESVSWTEIESAVSGEPDVQISESTLRNIAEATIVDLEMDIDGNIMFLLENSDGKSYCACAKYFMP